MRLAIVKKELQLDASLASFGVGSETTNAADGLMVYGADDPKLVDAFKRLLGSDPIYGATQGFLASLQRYLEGDEAARIDNGAQEFLERLQAQRRRLFFTIPEIEMDYGHWLMGAIAEATNLCSPVLASFRDGCHVR